MTEDISLTRQLGEAVARLYHDGMDLLESKDPKKYETTNAQLKEGAYVSIVVRLKDEFSASGLLMAAGADKEPDILFELYASNADAFGPSLVAVSRPEKS